MVGETPNLAARLQALAAPGAVVIAAATRRLVGDLFEYRDLRTVEVKGIAGPVPAWQALRPSAVASRFEALRGAAFSPLVGRDEEIDLLLRRWARAKAGDGQVVLLAGEPGIGKSRLTGAGRTSSSPAACPDAVFLLAVSPEQRAIPVHRPTPAGIRVRPRRPACRQAGETRSPALQRRTGRGGCGADYRFAVLAGVGAPPTAEPQSAAQEGKETGGIASAVGESGAPPAGGHGFRGRALDRPDLARIARPHGRADRQPAGAANRDVPPRIPAALGWPAAGDGAGLNRLDRRDRTVLVTQIAGGKALSDEVVAQIAERTDGVPLFVEELTKSVVESGASVVGIPATLHDSLMARFDRLASVRAVAQAGAAIGREFSYQLLRAVSHLPEDELQSALARLVTSELVFQRGTPPDAVYAFKHALVQDTAYGSMLRSSRQQLHAQIAAALETQSPELMDSQPELFARHHTEAGLVEKSIAYWGKAGRRSAARSAMAEAAAQYQKGLDQLALLPDTPERQRQELEFWNALAAVLSAVKGFAAPETGEAYDRAGGLWEFLGSPSEFLQIPSGQSRYHLNRGEFRRALRIAEDVLRLSSQRNESAGLVLGHHMLGAMLMLTGRFASSRPHLEEALALYDQMSPSSFVEQFGIHCQVVSPVFLGIALFLLGFPDQALARSGAAIIEARRLGHPPSLAVCLSTTTRLLLLVGHDAALDERANQLIAVATEHDFPHWRAEGMIFRGCALVERGDLVEGISLLSGGSAAYRATGAELWMPHYTALLAAACEIAGKVEEGLRLLDDALQIGERTGERWLDAELYRHKGELLLQQGNTKAAEELFGKALGVAKEQEAKLWELRAATSLARLRRDQGRRAEACDLLSPVYGWFTEGFETPDLKDAKALLDELSA